MPASRVVLSIWALPLQGTPWARSRAIQSITTGPGLRSGSRWEAPESLPFHGPHSSTRVPVSQPGIPNGPSGDPFHGDAMTGIRVLGALTRRGYISRPSRRVFYED